ncbi:unnamed protein product [Chilo suppressalis]|uniref:Uncharacterized protein n=1 Tax=Chilo suppressalis TaxID=168631 RepID=A0ABN8ATP9_CHISP|nr:unnamed protein product [Chilo suppressalis]
MSRAPITHLNLTATYTLLLKDINFLKANLADVVNELEESNNTIGELRAQLEPLSSAAWTKGFNTVERKKRKQICECYLYGVAPIGPNNLLRPEKPVTLLYVSRLHYTKKAEGIAEYLRTKTNFSQRIARLESRHDVNFNSFVKGLSRPAVPLRRWVMAQSHAPRDSALSRPKPCYRATTLLYDGDPPCRKETN